MTFLYLLPLFKPVSLSLSRIFFYSKNTPNKSFFNPINIYFVIFYHTLLFYNLLFFRFNVQNLLFYQIEISKSSSGVGEELDDNGNVKIPVQHTRRFTLGLHQSFYDSYMIYLLIDFCPGGELYDHCQTKPQKCLSHVETQFYAACVVLGKLIKRRSEHREWSTVVDISMTPPSFGAL